MRRSTTRFCRDLKQQFTHKGLDGCRMRNGFHFEYKGLHMTYHKTLPYSTIVETGEDGVTYDILYDILIKQNGDLHPTGRMCRSTWRSTAGSSLSLMTSRSLTAPLISETG